MKAKRVYQSIFLASGVMTLLLLSRPTWKTIIGGLPLVIIGETVRIWAAGHLERNRNLTTSGPYAYLRDPLYLGRLLLLVGFSIMAGGHGWILMVVGLGVFFFHYMPRKYHKEISRLEKIFGEEYKKYASSTRSLIPRLSPYPGAEEKRWNFTLFWSENREQYLLSGVLLLTATLILRVIGL